MRKTRAWHESLRIATEIHGVPVALYALIGLASLLAKRGDLEHALEMALIISNHPASSHDTKSHAAHLRAELEAHLASQQVESAQARARAKTFETSVKEVLKQDLFRVSS